jgi:hypothetical protein
VTLARDREDPLALQRERWFGYRNIPEEGVERAKADISCPCAVAALEFKMVEKRSQKRCVKFFHADF